ncbi:hypothetical protein conserved [Leishmania donovani]|uniref:Uncharacterized protein n=3 Tax=Leishmania donovani species complex TaxID=38574 RepID=A4I2T2_LEIIN|nr:conserved hypothetical protein [Leishmania infantum JPCM5]XP_003861974.1 hypothetical protein, conserved [Leishmania donovani]CAC9499686.1 hypothetical_protein_-_conserved [Leishmania infantum]AYU80015.1 hypothetical protein LdCL_270018600 [Leishmania donovani]CAJ1990000.1 hypothetical protein conserved [Leishmania donovani]CAM69082.1 conserved hypothetical protein [Leishmania infantum JPCM5]CBZ35279.1 hypothetical protein, conserved [Leishmania donovani]|eukprot:XP_001466365.1 conserved hypothetical protein [Leishmania infantum JPCM5]
MTHGALNAVSGFLSTISSRSAQSRRTHRPCIPYVLVAMTHHLPEMDILFGGAVTPSALTMNDEGGKFVAQRGSVQILVDAFHYAHCMETSKERAEEAKQKRCSAARCCQRAPGLDHWRSRPFSAATLKSGVVTRFSRCAARVRIRCRLPRSRQTSTPTDAASI